MDAKSRNLPSWFLKPSISKKSKCKSYLLQQKKKKKKEVGDPVKRTIYCMSPEEFKQYAVNLLKNIEPSEVEQLDKGHNVDMCPVDINDIQNFGDDMKDIPTADNRTSDKSIDNSISTTSHCLLEGTESNDNQILKTVIVPDSNPYCNGNAFNVETRIDEGKNDEEELNKDGIISVEIEKLPLTVTSIASLSSTADTVLVTRSYQDFSILDELM